MANLFRVEVSGGPLTIAQLEQLSRIVRDLVSEVTREHPAAGRGSLRWTVEEVTTGSLSLGLYARPADAEVPLSAGDEVAHSLAEGMRQLESEARRPSYFNDRALEHAKALASFSSGEITGVGIDGATGRTALDSQLIANVDRLMGQQVESIGSVEGRMEAINIHERPMFVVYDAVTNRRYECRFADKLSMEDILGAFGKRVIARGVIRQRAGGQPVIDVVGLHVLRPRDELPAAGDVRGILRKGE